MEQNNFNRLSTYEDVFSNLSEIVNEFLEVTDKEEIRNFNLIPIGLNNTAPSPERINNLIEDNLTSDELVEKIKESYLRRNSLKGEIGTLGKKEQYDGIINIALYMLMSNRLSKHYKSKLDKNSKLDETTKNTYTEKYRELMAKKLDATTKLIYSLFIYKETENPNDFLYGNFYDKNSSFESFIIALPIYGQISVHYGSYKKFNNIMYIVKQNINLILDKKLELGQITEEQVDNIKYKLDYKKQLIPRYHGYLYERVSGIPLDYCGPKITKAQNDLGLLKEMTDDDIISMSENHNYTCRELYYLAIKSTFSSEQLKTLSIHLKAREKQAHIQNESNKESSLDSNATDINLSTSNTNKDTLHVNANNINEENISNTDKNKSNLDTNSTNKKVTLSYKKSIDIQSIGTKLINLTTAEERQQVYTHETSLDNSKVFETKEK